MSRPPAPGERRARIAALYDIHGNLPALEAVLAEIRREGIERVVVGGDVVPGPMPRETIDALLHCGVPVNFLRGNGEQDVLDARRGQDLERVPEDFQDAVRWVANALSEEHVALLASWPPTCRVGLPPEGDVLFCHATPRDDNEIFTRLTPEDGLRPIFQDGDAAVVVCGHTHMQFDRAVGSVRVINAGSVGMPFGEPGAHWLVLEAGSGADLRRTPYDYDAATARILATDYPHREEMDVSHPVPADKMLRLLESAAIR